MQRGDPRADHGSSKPQFPCLYNEVFSDSIGAGASDQR